MAKQEPEPSGKQLIKDAKNKVKQTKKEQRNTNMKNLTTKFKTPITVALTLLTVAAFAATFYLGTQYQQNQHDTIVNAQKSAVTAALKNSAE